MSSTCTNHGSIASNPNSSYISGLESTTSVASLPASSQNLLLSLPSELRDKIYAYIFGSLPRTFSASSDTTVHALVRNSIYNPYDRYDDGVAGLSTCLLANKQILAEAMDEFHRSRIYVFETDKAPFQTPKDWMLYRQRRSHPNTLTYGGSGNITNVAFQPGRYVVGRMLRSWSDDRTEAKIAEYAERVEKHDSEILDRIYHGLGDNACLELRWTCGWPDATAVREKFLEVENQISHCFDERWNGRFRRILFCIRYFGTEWKMAQNVMETATKYSQKLVVNSAGVGKEVCWTQDDVIPGGVLNFSIWDLMSVIERKI
jgi:hypothetical protein